jgi:N-acetylmuramoyl-L-alanine amidase
VPFVAGPPAITVVYPTPNDVVDVRDSTFLLGSAGTGAATLTVNGQVVPVWPDGAWLAWVPVTGGDSLLTFTIAARAGGDSTTLVYAVRRIRRFHPPSDLAVWIDSTSMSPASRVWWPADDYLPLSVRAAEGAAVRVILPGGRVVPLAPDVGPEEPSAGIVAFDRDTANLATPPRADRYVGAIRGSSIGPSPGPLLGAAESKAAAPACCMMAPEPSRRAAPSLAPQASETPGSDSVIVEAVLGADTARARWPLRVGLLDTVPTIVEFNDDTAGKGNTDSLTVGRARPGATYHWFFPTGTRTVVTGRLGDDLRVRLSRDQEAWVPAADAIALPPGTPLLRGTVSSLTVTPSTDRLTLRIPVSQRVPFQVEEARNQLTLRLYNTVSDVNWTRYGANDSYLRDIRWQQATSDEVTVVLQLGGPVWGYRTRWSRNNLLFEIRRPPLIDPRHPLQGLLIVVDPGHPPLGATGPTGLREAEANLGVGLELRNLLTEGGARVIMTRTEDQTLDLLPRIKLADSVNADLLVSVHNNALPDGVNPFTNNGASVFYNHPRSLPLAQAIQQALVERFGVRDLGAARGDLALVRPTWMPAVLTEGLFMMLPDQEAALRQPQGRRMYALAVRDGIVAYLKRVAAERGTGVP